MSKKVQSSLHLDIYKVEGDSELQHKLIHQFQFTMKKYLIVCLAAILCISNFFNAGAQIKTSALSAQMDTIFKKYNKNSGSGCAVAIIRNGRVLFNREYGLANLEYSIPIKTTTTFDIALAAARLHRVAGKEANN